MTEVDTNARLRAWLERSASESSDPWEGFALAGHVIVAEEALDSSIEATLRTLAAKLGLEPQRAPLARELDDLADESPSPATLSRALTLRTELELGLVALETLGVPDALHDEDASFVVELDALLEPVLWRATALNDQRALLLHPIRPAHRARFPWLTRGIEVSASAVDALADVASLWAAFGEPVESELRGLVDAERRLGARRFGTDAAEVVDLASIRRAREVSAIAAAGLESFDDPYVDADVVFDDDSIGIRFFVDTEGAGLRVVSYAGGPDLDEDAFVSALAEDGRELTPTEVQSLPTLWWARFVGARPRTLRIGGRLVRLPS